MVTGVSCPASLRMQHPAHVVWLNTLPYHWQNQCTLCSLRVKDKSQVLYHLSYPGMFGGWGGIRTHGRFPFAGFQDRFLKPLGHPSNCGGRDGIRTRKALRPTPLLRSVERKRWGCFASGICSPKLVLTVRFELTTLWSQARCATMLRYAKKLMPGFCFQAPGGSGQAAMAVTSNILSFALIRCFDS